ncbi:MAG: hypothetical protein KDB60_06825 [Propionibacteriaceae bacterium]|jgi:O-antigen/teichoic acid export membrane protein|nr:hypothetical protein [Propionibacteriaceae bacterium]
MLSRAPVSFAVKDDEVATGPEVSDIEHVGVRRRLRQMLAYAGFPMLGVLTPLLALPTISREFGANGWAAIAVGQSVGAAASVAVELGWGLTGPQAAAASDPRDLQRLFASSLMSRAAAALAIVPAVVIVVILLDPHYVAAACLAAVAMTMSGFTTNWLYIGMGRPTRIFLTDALPRFFSVLAGVISITLLDAPLAAFSAWLVAGFLASPLFSLLLERPTWQDFRQAESVGSNFRRQRVALAGRGFSAIYIGLPVALVQAWAPNAVAGFAAVERLLRMGLLVLQGVPNSLYRTVGRTPRIGCGLGRVEIQVIRLQAGVGVVAGLVCVLLLPTTVHLVFAGQVEVGTSSCWVAGAIVLLTCLSRATGMLLVSRAAVGWVTASAGVAAGAAVSLLAVLPSEYGPVGALAALAIAETMALAVQAYGLHRNCRQPRGRAFRASSHPEGVGLSEP